MVRLNRTHYSLLQAKSPKSFVQNTVRLNRTHYSLLKILQAKFSIFQNCPIKSGSSELRKFRAVRPHSPRITQNLHILLTLSIMFQVPAPAENPGKFQRITQIPHDSPTQPTNHANSAHFAL